MPPTPHHSAQTMEDGLTAYLDSLRRYRLLTREQEMALAPRIRAGDDAALGALVCANLKFVVSVAKRYQNRGVALADLINEGNLGLIRAAQRYDERKGIKFISYAVWWIRQAIVQALADQSRIIRVPVGSAWKVEIARSHLSLDAPVGGGDGARLLDYLPDELAAAPDEAPFENELTMCLQDALSRLQPRQARILRLHFGLDGRDPMTLEQIGELLGVTRERVRQLEEKALTQLRRPRTTRTLAAWITPTQTAA